jgi:chemotaxis protein MotB
MWAQLVRAWHRAALRRGAQGTGPRPAIISATAADWPARVRAALSASANGASMALFVAWALVTLAGCSSSSGGGSSWASGWGVVPKSRYDSLTSQNRTLAERARAQQTEIENLRLHSRNVEDQLIQAEEDLARLDDHDHRQQQKLANFKHEHDELDKRYGRPAHSSTNAMPAALSGRLAELAERYPSLHYDPKSGVSKFDTDVLFDSGEAQLTPSARRMLGEFADVFQAPEARDLKIMIVGHTDGRGIKGREARQKYPNNWHLSAGRAVAVVERLREAGLPENRMGIAGFAQYQPISPNDTASSRKKNRRVEIFVVGPETPVVGWTETLDSVYR